MAVAEMLYESRNDVNGLWNALAYEVPVTSIAMNIDARSIPRMNLMLNIIAPRLIIDVKIYKYYINFVYS